MLIWPGVVSAILIVFWLLAIFVFAEGINMILHAYSFGITNKNRIKAIIIGRGIDVFAIFSGLFVFGSAVYYGWMIYKLVGV